jgi:ketosteroid isomerase-like protein
MTTLTQPVTGAAIKKAIEGRDGKALAALYADHAVTRIVDHNNPPSKPREIRGRGAIATFWDDICSRTMTHKVDVTMADGDQMAFTQACTYPDGAKVYCIAVLKLENGLIAEQTVVQAWDE